MLNPAVAFMLNRRSFLASAGAFAVGTKMGVLDFASSLPAAEPTSAKKPVVHVVFVRPKTSDPERPGERPVISWPGYQFDIKAGEALHKKVLTEAAQKLGVEIVIRNEPLGSDDAVNAYLVQLKKSPPDGLFIVALELFRWGWVNRLAQNRGEIPTIVYSPMGSSFTEMLKPARALPKTFVGATQDIHWPAFGLRMLNTVWRMKNTRLCIVQGD